ncbi:MAG: hypothetical protein R3275_09010 [Saprospiraceae bacterium]|nr:hypothetical protein [Saprospiraceae bacterium]
MRIYNYTYLILVIVFTACNGVADIPEPGNDGAIFRSELTIDGQPFLLEAGSNDYILDAGHNEENGQVYFISHFKERDCALNCENSLLFKIYSEQPTNTGFDIDEALSDGMKDLAWMNRNDSLTVVLNHLSEGNPENSFYLYDNKRIKIGRDSFPTSFNIHRRKEIEICLEDRASGQGLSRHCQTLTPTRSAPPRVKLTIADPSIARFEAVPVQPFDNARAVFDWTPSSTGRSLTIDPVEAVGKEICVNVGYRNQNIGSSKSCLKIDQNVKRFNLVSLFKVVEFREVKPNFDDKTGKVEVEFIDGSRTSYTSRLYSQGATNFFRIDAVEDFFDPTLEENVKLVHVSFDLVLYNSIDDFINIKSDTTTLAIRYPM